MESTEAKTQMFLRKSATVTSALPSTAIRHSGSLGPFKFEMAVGQLRPMHTCFCWSPVGYVLNGKSV